MKKIVVLLCVGFSFLLAKPYTDMLGRSVIINKAEKLAFIGPGALRLGVYLGLQDRLVGVEKFELKPNQQSPYRSYIGKEALKKLPIIGNGGPAKMPNLEALINVQPDVIFTSFIQKDQIALIEKKTGIPVVALSYGASYGGKGTNNLDEIKNSITLIGSICQKSKRAKELVDFITSQEEELSKVTMKIQTLYIGGVAYKGIQPLTSTEVEYPPFELLGLKNEVFKDNPEAKGHQFIDFEALLRTNPDVIFTDSYSKKRIALDYKNNKALYDTLSAYKSHNVKEVLSFNNYSTNVENLILIAWQIADYLGEDVSVSQKVQEIYAAFYPKNSEKLLKKLDYKLEEK